MFELFESIWLFGICVVFIAAFGTLLVCHFMSSSTSCFVFVLHLPASICIESKFTLIMFSTMVSGIPNSTWLFPGTTKKTQCFVTFLNLICTAQVCNCVISVLLYVNLMFFIDFLNVILGPVWTIFYKCTVALNCPCCQCLFFMELLWCCYWPLSLDLQWSVTAYYSRISSLYLLFPCLPVGLLHFPVLPHVLCSCLLICTPSWSVLFSHSHHTSFHRPGTVLVHVFPCSISMVILGCLYSVMSGGLSLSSVQLLPCQSFHDLSLCSILQLVLSVPPCVWPISKHPCCWRGHCYFFWWALWLSRLACLCCQDHWWIALSVVCHTLCNWTQMLPPSVYPSMPWHFPSLAYAVFWIAVILLFH